MNNPFKAGDKVVRLPEYLHLPLWERSSHGSDRPGTVYTVTMACPFSVWLDDDDEWPWDASRFRAAIAGQDYPAPRSNGTLEYAPNIGHLPDGSSVQKHSAGPLYPCVIVMRDGQLGGKYDYGVISPRNQEPLWLSNHAAVVTLAETIKKDLT